MKKILAFALCLMMLLCSGFASADTTAPHAAESLYDGLWVQFGEEFEMYMPIEWYEYQCTPEMNAMGVFYMAGTKDLSQSCTLGWAPLEEQSTIEDLHAEIVSVYPDAQIMDVSGVQLVYYKDAANNLLNYLTLDTAEPGFYMFVFSPADDVDFAVQTALIASTIRAI